jgi:plastocyanin
MRATRLSLVIVSCLVAWCLTLAAPAWAGTIRGAVRLAGGAPEHKKVVMTVDQSVCGKEKDAEDLMVSADKGIRNVVVSLQSPPADAKARVPAPVQMDQKQCEFVPRVVLIPAGGTVEFLNGDRLLHNLRSQTKDNASFNRTQPKGRTIPIAFKAPEFIRIDCDLHPWMRAWVVVTEHPFYAVTGEHGEFVLDDVPPGNYILRLWHESLGTLTRAVTVGAGATTVNVEMGRR